MRERLTAWGLASTAKTFLKDPSEFRFAPRWLCSLLPGRNPMADHRPWMNFRVIDWLESYLKPGMRVFEYGSGGSTLFLAERVAQVVSVEHDEGFYAFMEERFRHERISNCTYVLSAPQPADSSKLPPYGCASFTSEWPTQRNMSFEAYVKAIDNYPDGAFDLVVVDGRARPSCAFRARPKVRTGGWLLVDNMERPRYTIIRDILAQYEYLDFSGLVPYGLRPQRTMVWRISVQ